MMELFVFVMQFAVLLLQLWLLHHTQEVAKSIHIVLGKAVHGEEYGEGK